MKEFNSKEETFSFPLERDYRRAEPSSDEKAVEFVRSLREKGFFTLYEAMCARMTRVVVPEHQAAFERLGRPARPSCPNAGRPHPRKRGHDGL